MPATCIDLLDKNSRVKSGMMMMMTMMTMRSIPFWLVTATWCLLHLSLPISHSLTVVEPSRNSGISRRKYFGDVLTGGALISGGTTTAIVVAPEPAHADVAKTLMRIGQAFPGALTNDELLSRVSSRLSKRGFDRNNTLVASSLCSDEVNRPLEETFYRYYGNSYFAMGGLAGFPFSGLTGFGAMASHIPDDGNCLLVYGPHVGVDSEGNVGKVDRVGKSKSGTCCGSAVYASKYLNTVLSGEADIMGPPNSPFDAQQVFVTNMLLPYASEIQESKEPMVALPFLAYKPIDNMMTRIVAKASSKVGKGRIAMLGGLQINTPEGMSDYFLPLRFDVRESTNEIIVDMLEAM